MKNKENFKAAVRLINQKLNLLIDTYTTQSKEVREMYLIRYAESIYNHIALQPTYCDTFYNIRLFTRIAEEHNLNYYIDVQQKFG